MSHNLALTPTQAAEFLTQTLNPISTPDFSYVVVIEPNNTTPAGAFVFPNTNRDASIADLVASTAVDNGDHDVDNAASFTCAPDGTVTSYSATFAMGPSAIPAGMSLYNGYHYIEFAPVGTASRPWSVKTVALIAQTLLMANSVADQPDFFVGGTGDSWQGIDIVGNDCPIDPAKPWCLGL